MRDTVDLLGMDFVQHALIASILLGIISGAIAPIIVMRRMSFAAHASGELAMMGAAGALLLGIDIGLGAVCGSLFAVALLSVLGHRRSEDSRDYDSIVAVLLSFGLGLSVLFIYLYPGRSSTALSLLTGQIVGVATSRLWILAVVALLVVGFMVIGWRSVVFATVDPVIAAASGIHVRTISVLFALLVGLVASQGVQIIGALLLLALLITPGAAAVQVTSNPVMAVVLSGLFAVISAAGGVVLSLAPGVPVSVFITSISFGIYLLCRGYGTISRRRVAVEQTH